MKIKELMKKDPIIVGPNESLESVSKKMARNGKDVVIVKDDDTVKGLVTAREIFFAVKSYVLGKSFLESIPMEIRDIKISELMKGPLAMEFMEACGLTGANSCIMLGEDDSIANAMRVMAISGVDHILVVGDDGVTGTLSDNDILNVFK